MNEETTRNKTTINSSLKSVGGSLDDDFNTVILNKILPTIAVRDPSDETRNAHINALLAAMEGIGPRNEIEGMLATQMVACHFAAMYPASTVFHRRSLARAPAPCFRTASRAEAHG